MGQPSRDAAFELFHACRHSVSFALGGPLGYPDTPAGLSEKHRPDALFERLQAVSPPPKRDGGEWYEGLLLDGEPFDPAESADRLAEVHHAGDIVALDIPDPDDIVLDETVAIARPDKPEPMRFPGPDEGKTVLSISYWSPIPEGAKETETKVEYYGKFEFAWSRPPRDTWVAVSLDGFWPPERDSADIIIPLGACDARCP